MSIRPNARTLRSSPKQIISSLIPLYHQSAHFLPLRPSSLPSTLDPILAPLDSAASHNPLPYQLGPLTDRQARLNADRHLAHLATSLTESIKTDSVYRSPVITKAPLRNSWLDAQRTGREHALVGRVRRVVDGLCGTVAGGQAGVVTVAELGAGAVEDAKVRTQERSQEEEAAKKQEAQDARLEQEYREEEEARA